MRQFGHQGEQVVARPLMRRMLLGGAEMMVGMLDDELVVVESSVRFLLVSTNTGTLFKVMESITKVSLGFCNPQF